jgi:alpha-beta hydrolase superfamily lysophospholipase
MRKLLKRTAIGVLIIFVVLNIITAFHAYKFTHFYDSKGTPIKKPEQMTGGEKLQAIVFGVAYSRREIKEFPAYPYETFFTTTADGVKLESWYVPVPNAKGTVIMFHGHGGNKAGVLAELDVFHQAGYNAVAVDFRAHGNSAGDVCTIGYKEAQDVKAVYDYVKAKGEQHIILYGISLGAASITKAFEDYADLQPSKVILEMPYGTLSDAVKGRLRMMHLPEQPFAALLTFWGGVGHGFWAFDLDPENYAASIKVPTLLQWGRHDARVTEQETMNIFNNLGTPAKTLVVYEESGHQSLVKNETDKWKAAVLSFLQ